jgi:hypothetical protein
VYLSPQTKEWQAFVIRAVVAWITDGVAPQLGLTA